MAREVQKYVTELLQTLLGPAETEKRFPWCRGDARDSGSAGRPLPYDAVWEDRKLIVEVDERQHSESVAFFDKPHRLTVSGVHRGQQRRLYDERKARCARENGYTVIRIPAGALAWQGRRLLRDLPRDLSTLHNLLNNGGIARTRHRS